MAHIGQQQTGLATPQTPGRLRDPIEFLREASRSQTSFTPQQGVFGAGLPSVQQIRRQAQPQQQRIAPPAPQVTQEDSLLNFGERLRLSFAGRSREDKKRVLEASGFTVFQDTDGSLIVSKDGKISKVDETKFTAKDAADLAGKAPAFIGQLLGGAIGAGVGLVTGSAAGGIGAVPGAFVGGGTGGALGGGAGEAVSQAIGRRLGVREDFDPGEIGKEAGLGALGGVTFRLGGPLVGRFAPKLAGRLGLQAIRRLPSGAPAAIPFGKAGVAAIGRQAPGRFLGVRATSGLGEGVIQAAEGSVAGGLISGVGAAAEGGTPKQVLGATALGIGFGGALGLGAGTVAGKLGLSDFSGEIPILTPKKMFTVATPKGVTRHATLDEFATGAGFNSERIDTLVNQVEFKVRNLEVEGRAPSIEEIVASGNISEQDADVLRSIDLTGRQAVDKRARGQALSPNEQLIINKLDAKNEAIKDRALGNLALNIASMRNAIKGATDPADRARDFKKIIEAFENPTPENANLRALVETEAIKIKTKRLPAELEKKGFGGLVEELRAQERAQFGKGVSRLSKELETPRLFDEFLEKSRTNGVEPFLNTPTQPRPAPPISPEVRARLVSAGVEDVPRTPIIIRSPKAVLNTSDGNFLPAPIKDVFIRHNPEGFNITQVTDRGDAFVLLKGRNPQVFNSYREAIRSIEDAPGLEKNPEAWQKIQIKKDEVQRLSQLDPLEKFEVFDTSSEEATRKIFEEERSIRRLTDEGEERIIDDVEEFAQRNKPEKEMTPREINQLEDLRIVSQSELDNQGLLPEHFIEGTSVLKDGSTLGAKSVVIGDTEIIPPIRIKGITKRGEIIEAASGEIVPENVYVPESLVPPIKGSTRPALTEILIHEPIGFVPTTKNRNQMYNRWMRAKGSDFDTIENFLGPMPHDLRVRFQKENSILQRTGAVIPKSSLEDKVNFAIERLKIADTNLKKTPDDPEWQLIKLSAELTLGKIPKDVAKELNNIKNLGTEKLSGPKLQTFLDRFTDLNDNLAFSNRKLMNRYGPEARIPEIGALNPGEPSSFIIQTQRSLIDTMNNTENGLSVVIGGKRLGMGDYIEARIAEILEPEAGQTMVEAVSKDIFQDTTFKKIVANRYGWRSAFADKVKVKTIGGNTFNEIDIKFAGNNPAPIDLQPFVRATIAERNIPHPDIPSQRTAYLEWRRNILPELRSKKLTGKDIKEQLLLANETTELKQFLSKNGIREPGAQDTLIKKVQGIKEIKTLSDGTKKTIFEDNSPFAQQVREFIKREQDLPKIKLQFGDDIELARHERAVAFRIKPYRGATIVEILPTGERVRVPFERSKLINEKIAIKQQIDEEKVFLKFFKNPKNRTKEFIRNNQGITNEGAIDKIITDAQETTGTRILADGSFEPVYKDNGSLAQEVRILLKEDAINANENRKLAQTARLWGLAKNEKARGGLLDTHEARLIASFPNKPPGEIVDMPTKFRDAFEGPISTGTPLRLDILEDPRVGLAGSLARRTAPTDVDRPLGEEALRASLSRQVAPDDVAKELTESPILTRLFPKNPEKKVSLAKDVTKEIQDMPDQVIPFEKITLPGGTGGGSISTKNPGDMGVLGQMGKITKGGFFQVGNEMRTAMTIFDVSFLLRQGAMVGARHPGIFMSLFPKTFRSLFSESATLAYEKALKSDEIFQIFNREVPTMFVERTGELAKRADDFMTVYLKQIPIIRNVVNASERAFSTASNMARLAVLKKMMKVVGSRAIGESAEAKLLRSQIADHVGALTGRGILKPDGLVNRNRAVVNNFLFSAGLMKSRLFFLDPRSYLNPKIDPFVRKETFKAALAFSGAILTTLGLASAGGVKVGTDMNSSDFGKMRFNDTRIDLMAGFQQYIVALSRLTTGNYTTGKGKNIDLSGGGFLSRYDVALRFAENKEAPLFSFMTTMLKGTSWDGQPLEVQKEIINRMTPIVIQDILDIADKNPELLPAGILAFLGAGVQTY